MKSTLKTNILLSVIAQVISLCANFLLGLILPRYIEVEQYAYWQTFLLYSSYVGVLHFGLIDGIILRYSQYNYDTLNKPLIRSQLAWLMVITTIAAIICISCSVFIQDQSMKMICIFVGLCIIINNLVYYATYVYQITNEISKYVSVIIVERITTIILVVIFLLLKKQQYYWLCIAQISGSCLGIVFAVIRSKELFIGPILSIKKSLVEVKENISAGIKLLAANWSAMFIVGGAKTFIQWHWSIMIFGFISFSFSLTNLFLTFVTSVSIVLFPALKRLPEDKLYSLYPRLRMQLTIILIVMMIFYYPIQLLLPMWLPKYTYSLYYFGLILPIVIFTSKLSLLTNNYLKVFRKEKEMLLINISTLIIALVGYVLCTYVFDNLEMIIYWTVVIIIFRAIMSELIVAKLLKTNFKIEIISELIMCFIFSISLHLDNSYIGASVYLSAILVYLAFIFSSSKRRLLILKSKVL